MVIGLDLGTTSLSAVLFEPERQVVIGSAECPNSAGVTGLAEGYHEQCAASISAAAYGLVASLVRQSRVPPERIEGLALTGQQHGLVVVDAGLRPLTNLITWRDQRTATAPVQLRNHGYAADTGCFLHAGYGGLTLHHLLRAGQLPKGAFKVLPITGFLAAQLTGRCSVDETMAASWGIFDVQSRCWHQPLLPELAASSSPLGAIVHAHATGLTPQTIVYNPAGDNQAGFAGIGDLGGREAAINLGTSAQLSVFSPRYAFSPGLETRPFPGGGFLRVYAALCGGWAYAYLAEFFQQVVQQLGGLTVSLPEMFDRMQEFAATTDARGLCADTRFAGERDGEAVAGKLNGINVTNFTPANLARAFANGIAGELAGSARKMEFGHIKHLAVVGNAAHRNPLLVRALEQQFGLPCRVVAAGREAALGVARLAAHLNPGEPHAHISC
jgi:sedoheptulokinase